jgi:putative transposase
MYRILRARHQVRERRQQARHPAHLKPELVATGPNQVWSWDITKLAGPYKWNWFHLYVIIDVWSRFAVGWLVAPRESDRLAHDLIAATAHIEGIEPEQLTLHADRGSSMTSRTVAQLLADLGVTRSHSRPHVSNDNPFSESQFKTLKNTPRFPERFTSLAHARTFVDTFFAHYNHHHRHSGIGYHTPASVHLGHHHAIRAHRQAVLDHAYATQPHRFRRPHPPSPTSPGSTHPTRICLIPLDRFRSVPHCHTLVGVVFCIESEGSQLLTEINACARRGRIRRRCDPEVPVVDVQRHLVRRRREPHGRVSA